MDWGKANKQSLIVPFLDNAGREDGRHYFQQIDWRESGLVPECGDLLGFRIGKCVQHLGVTIQLNPTFFMSALEDGAQLRRLDDATWFTRLEKVWRPME